MIDYHKLRTEFNKDLETILPKQLIAPIVQRLIESVKRSEDNGQKTSR
jgi:hypothetical protein